MLTHLILAISMFVGLGILLILQSNAFRPLAAGLLIAPVRLRVAQKRRDGMSLRQAAVDERGSEGGTTQPSKP
jgi:hypothetical protein